MSNAACHGEATVSVYDSAYTTVGVATMVQVCSFLTPAASTLTFLMMNVQRQPNSRDCGLFAIAVAIELSQGRHPLVCSWDTQGMRQHLLNCLEAGNITPFPLLKVRQIHPDNCIKNVTVCTVHCTCICRTVKQIHKPRVKCNNCKEWFHNTCIGLDKDSTTFNHKWLCASCITA